MNIPSLSSCSAHARRAICGAAVLSFCVLAQSSPTEAEAPNKLAQAHANFPWQGEELFFKVQVNGSDAAHAVIRVGEVRRIKDQPYVPLSAKAKSVGFFHTIYPMDDRANTYINPLSLMPLRSEKVFKEAGKGRTYEVDYQPAAYRAKVHKVYHKDAKHDHERERDFTRDLPPETHDAFTWFFDLRQRDDLKKDKELIYYVYDGWKISKLYLKVVGEDRVLTPMGWHTATKIDFQREIITTRRRTDDKDRPIAPKQRVLDPAKPTGSLWLTADERRIPVKIAMTSTHGLGEVILAKYTPADPAKTKATKKP